jgi:superfamily II DNA/RNA helicase
LAKSLQKHGFSVGALHGDMEQSARTAALEAFRRGELPILVASDVAARGLDIPEVSHVINFDVPHHPDDYVHRIGRTGRAGRAGTAISIVAPSDHKSVAAIEKLIGQDIPKADIGTEPEPLDEGAAERPVRAHRRSSERSGEPRSGEPRARKPRREPRRSHAPDNSLNEPRAAIIPATPTPAAPRPAAARPVAASAPRPAPVHPARLPAAAAAAPRPPSIGRTPTPQTPRDSDSEPADHSHLPAFLLRPIRVRG